MLLILFATIFLKETSSLSGLLMLLLLGLVDIFEMKAARQYGFDRVFFHAHVALFLEGTHSLVTMIFLVGLAFMMRT